MNIETRFNCGDEVIYFDSYTLERKKVLDISVKITSDETGDIHKAIHYIFRRAPELSRNELECYASLDEVKDKFENGKFKTDKPKEK